MITGKPAALRRITTRYVPAEDRIRLSGEIDDGETVAIWLTLRLLQRLVPKLLARLESRSVSSAHHELLQEFAQARAVADQVPVPPVMPAPVEAAWLASGVVLEVSGNDLLLTFSEDGGREALVMLSPSALRQWLSIVYRAYRKAAWPLDIWPGWIAGATDSMVESKVPLVH